MRSFYAIKILMIHNRIIYNEYLYCLFYGSLRYSTISSANVVHKHLLKNMRNSSTKYYGIPDYNEIYGHIKLYKNIFIQCDQQRFSLSALSPSKFQYYCKKYLRLINNLKGLH